MLRRISASPLRLSETGSYESASVEGDSLIQYLLQRIEENSSHSFARSDVSMIVRHDRKNLDDAEAKLGSDIALLIARAVWETTPSLSLERRIRDVCHEVSYATGVLQKNPKIFANLVMTARIGHGWTTKGLVTLGLALNNRRISDQELERIPYDELMVVASLRNGIAVGELPQDAEAQYVQVARRYEKPLTDANLLSAYRKFPRLLAEGPRLHENTLYTFAQTSHSSPAGDNALADMARKHPDQFKKLETDDHHLASALSNWSKKSDNHYALLSAHPDLSFSDFRDLGNDHFPSQELDANPLGAMERIYGKDLPLFRKRYLLKHPYNIGQKLSAIDAAQKYRFDGGNSDYLDKLVGVFGNSLPQFLAKFDKENLLGTNLSPLANSHPTGFDKWTSAQEQLLHDIAQRIPAYTNRQQIAGLDRFLLNWTGRGMNDLVQSISMSWPKLPKELRQAATDDLPANYARILGDTMKVPEDYRHLMPMIQEAHKWGVPFEPRKIDPDLDADYDSYDGDDSDNEDGEYQDRDPYNARNYDQEPRDMSYDEETNHFFYRGEDGPNSTGPRRPDGTLTWNPWGSHADSDRWNPWMAYDMAAPLPEWTKFSASAGGLTGRFLPRDDVRGLFLGQYTNCCQHPTGAGADCAYHGQLSHYGAFFVVEDKAGEIIAQSWVWQAGRDRSTGKTRGICFDNVEAKGIGEKRMPFVLHIYQSIAKQIMESGIPVVNVGGGMNDMSVNHLPQASMIEPVDYEAYRDSDESQRTLYHPETAPVHDFRQPVPYSASYDPEDYEGEDNPIYRRQPEAPIPHWKDLLAQANGVAAPTVALALLRGARFADRIGIHNRADELECRAAALLNAWDRLLIDP